MWPVSGGRAVGASGRPAVAAGAPDTEPVNDLVDWDLAAATAARLSGRGPQPGWTDVADAVHGLRRASQESREHVARVARLPLPSDDDGAPPAEVVDRGQWARRNVEALRVVASPLLEAVTARRDGPPDPLSALVGPKVAAAEVGGLLALMSSRVLGQYELFRPRLPDGTRDVGRLLLVAPNIAAAVDALEVPAQPFRLWVCLHEEAHRQQFAAVGWLGEHVEHLLGEFVAAGDLDASALVGRLRAGVAAAVRGLRAGPDDVADRAPSAGLLDAVQTPAQREVLARVQALMSVVEGHAEWVMDVVGPEVVEDLDLIRARFEERRRRGAGPLDVLLRRLLGLEAKMQQYRQGKAFVSAVVDAAGVDAFNRVWTSPETLPSPAEVLDPDAWVARVVGPRALPAA